MTADPREKTNVLSTERRTYASMRDELGTRGATVEGPANIDPEEAKKLAALGYLSSTSAATGPLPDPKDRIGEVTEMIQATELLAQNKPDEAAARFRAILAEESAARGRVDPARLLARAGRPARGSGRCIQTRDRGCSGTRVTTGVTARIRSAAPRAI
jgi:hypothetical protein